MSKETNYQEDIFTDEDVELLSQAFEEGDQRLCKDIIHDLGFHIGLVYYPSRNILLWPFRDYRSRGAWISKIITKRDYEALVNGIYVSDDEDPDEPITQKQGKVFLRNYRDKFGPEWQILAGWKKFWICDSKISSEGVRMISPVGNPIANVKRICGYFAGKH